MADKPDFNEPKIATSFSLTEVARVRLQEITDFYGLKSRSDLLERLARGLIDGVLWLKPDEKEVTIETFDEYIEKHRNMVTEEENKKKNKEPYNEEFTLIESIKILQIRLIRYRLTGDSENQEIDTLEKAYQKLKKEKGKG